ncbi:MAG: gliding motility-associated ABC transporter ATP-binding subunit GldA [Acidimicrobiia bacterium]|nr:MAG: gliding motility-associated ABC transporter ATP-binding subunit GldA [Acidimicrobiia bacterium]
MTAPAIEIRQLRKRYHKVEALRGLDLEVPRGSICGFLGPNGAGKTTTMKILLGLIRPSDGWAAVLGDDVRTHGLVARSRIGYLPQDPVFPPNQTVRGVVSYVARLYPGHPHGRALRRRVDGMLDRVGMADKARRRVRGLSGGERQRLGVAQALISNPELVVMDEPSAGLDPVGRRDMLDLIAEIGGETTVFYSTHILDDVEQVSDTVVIINNGRAIAAGPLESILETSDSEYTVRLRGATEGTFARLTAEPWVQSVDAQRRREVEQWRVRVTDGAAAADRIVPTLLADDGCDILEFHLSDRRLEDAYLEIVGADDGD